MLLAAAIRGLEFTVEVLRGDFSKVVPLLVCMRSAWAKVPLFSQRGMSKLQATFA